MTLLEAVSLALLGHRHRRLMAALVRMLAGRGSVEDTDSVPARGPDEAVIDWFARLGAGVGLTGRGPQSLVSTAGAQVARAQAAGAVAVWLSHESYPPLLATIPDPPPVLWVRGQPAALHRPAVAIVGSRGSTQYGLNVARRLAADLAAAGVVVVSGLARGIDQAAHAASVSVDGTTVGVLGCGIDRIYPAEHRALAADLERRGAIVSEFPVGVPPLPHHFPLRNRIISGLSTAVVVVEAPEKSGALITASSALEQGREVMVIPGQIGGRNRGGHGLIRDGAKVVESADDVLKEVGFGVWAAAGAAAGLPARLPETVEFTVDEVASQTGQPPGTVLAQLLELELAGRIQRIGGGRFARVLT